MSSRVTETRLCKYRMGRSCCKWCQFPCKPRLKSGHGKGFFRKVYIKRNFWRQTLPTTRKPRRQIYLRTRMHSSRWVPPASVAVSTVGRGEVSASGSVGCVPLGPGEGVARQTPVKTLPCPKLPLREVINGQDQISGRISVSTQISICIYFPIFRS